MKGRLFATARGAIGQANINSEELKSFLLPIPPLEEQRRIVSLLDRAAEIRRRADAARARARAIVPALFLDMFGDPASNPKGWPQVRFGDVVAEFRYGTNQKCHDTQSADDVAVLRIPNVIGGRIDWSQLKYARLSEKERTKTDLRAGDVLFVRTNGNPEYIGRCATFKGGRTASYASYLIRARLSQDVLPTFVISHFNHEQYRPLVVRAGRTTAGNYNLSTEGLGALSVMFPPIPIQTAFAQQAQRIQATARALDTAATRAEAMAAALSAEVFEGARKDSDRQ
jgi:type I restriction enzyme S subunit